MTLLIKYSHINTFLDLINFYGYFLSISMLFYYEKYQVL